MDWLKELLEGISTFELVIWGLAIGMIAAIISTSYNRTLLGGFVRTLISCGALSADSAMTLAEAGYEKNVFVKKALIKGFAFRKIVFEVDDEIVIASEGHSFSARTKPLDLTTARFYIAEENRRMAESRYDNKGADVFGVIVSIIGVIALAYCVTLFIPWVLAFFEIAV